MTSETKPPTKPPTASKDSGRNATPGVHYVETYAPRRITEQQKRRLINIRLNAAVETDMTDEIDNYHCNGFKHTYTGNDFFLHGSAPCPEYPACRSEAATLRAMEEEDEMGDYSHDYHFPTNSTGDVKNYTGIITTGERLLDPDVPAVDILAEAVKLPTPTPLTQTFQVLGDVAAERQKQEIKWGQQNHDNLMWSAILAEEVGESAQEVLTEVWGKEAGHGHGDLREELVQVAAVAVAWIEAIDRRAK